MILLLELSRTAEMARVRSPNYPVISLPEAIAKAKMVHDAEQHLAAPKEVIAKHLGFSGLNGGSYRIISAMAKYGLLEEINGDKVKVSSTALSILHPRDEEEKAAAIREAAARPPLFAEISNEWPSGVPSDANLRSYLVRRNFSADAIDRVIQGYRETMALVTQEPGGYANRDSDPKGRQDREIWEMQPAQNQTPPGRRDGPPVTPLPSSEPYRLSLASGRLQGTFDLTSAADADEMIQAINAWKVLVRKKDEAAN